MKQNNLDSRYIKKSLLFLSFFVFSSFIYSLPNNFKFSIEPLYSLTNGTFIEYVYTNDGNTGQLTKLSELDWPMQNISSIGSKIEFCWKFLFATSELSFAIPKKSGFMYDYDWLDYYGNFNWEDPFMCTNFSSSFNEVTSAFNFNFMTGATFNPFLSFYINPFLGFLYNSINFFSQYGFYQYATHQPFTTEQPLPLLLNSAVTYERQTTSFLLGLSLEYFFFKRVTLSLSFFTTPVNYTESVDHHHSSNIYYLDIMTGFFTQWNFTGNLEIKILQNFSFTTDFAYNLQFQKNGKNFSHMGQKKFYSSDLTSATSACSGKWWNFTTGAKWNF